MRNVRLICPSAGADEFNITAPDGNSHSFKVRPDGCWVVDSAVAQIIVNSHGGFTESYDDTSTLSEIQLLVSVLENAELRTAITAAIASAKVAA